MRGPPYTFSGRSRTNLNTCHRQLISVAHQAIKVVNFTVVEGHRSKQEQNEYYRTGRSQLQWPDSKHNAEPSRAYDLAPWIPGTGIPWTDRASFAYLAGRILAEADRQGVAMRWGGDWDADGYLVNQDVDESFYDAGHFELTEEG
jgi:hypothetical protein